MQKVTIDMLGLQGNEFSGYLGASTVSSLRVLANGVSERPSFHSAGRVSSFRVEASSFRKKKGASLGTPKPRYLEVRGVYGTGNL